MDRDNSLEFQQIKTLLSIAPRKGIRISESGKILFVESGILGFGIRNTAQGIRNPINYWNQEPIKFDGLVLESRIQVPLKLESSQTCNTESTTWNPESKTGLHSLFT